MKKLAIIICIILLNITSKTIYSQSININSLDKQQLINIVGGDMERSQFFLQKSANPQEISDWCYKDIPLMVCRVSYDKKQELTEGEKNLNFYSDCIKSMHMIRSSNPQVKFYATMKSDYNGYGTAGDPNTNNLPSWICDYIKGNKPTHTYFYTYKYALFLADYLELMHNEGLTIDFLSLSKEWRVITVDRTIEIINSLKMILNNRNVPMPKITDPASWSVNQSVEYVNEVIKKNSTNLFYAFSTHDYNNSAEYYPEFVKACKSAGKHAWNDETGIARDGRTYGKESVSIDGLLSLYTEKVYMYESGIEGEIFFENFSRGVDAETRSIYFKSGQKGERMRSYYVLKEFASHLYQHYFIPVNISTVDNIKAMAFINEDEVSLCVINSGNKKHTNIEINMDNISIDGDSYHHYFDSLSIVKGVRRSIKDTNGRYYIDLNGRSLNFFNFQLKENIDKKENISISAENEFIEPLVSMNNECVSSRYILYGENLSSDIKIELVYNDSYSFNIGTETIINQDDIVWNKIIEVNFKPKEEGIYNSGLKISTSQFEKTIPLIGESYISDIINLPFIEDFPHIKNNSDYVSISTLNSYSKYKGWNIHNGINNSLDRINIVSQTNNIGYIETPFVVLDGAFEFKFYARMLQSDRGQTAADKKKNNEERNFFVTLDCDTIYNHKKSGSNLYQNYNEWTCTYVYDGIETLKIFPQVSDSEVWNDNSDGLTFGHKSESIKIQSTTLPALNIGYGRIHNCGVLKPNEINIINIPLKAYNINSNILLSFLENSKFSSITKQFVPIDGIVNEDMILKINTENMNIGNYTDKLIIKSENNEFKERIIWLNYEVISSTENKEHSKAKDYHYVITDNVMHIYALKDLEIQVTNLLGSVISHYKIKENENYTIRLDNGLNLVQLNRNIEKIIIRQY